MTATFLPIGSEYGTRHHFFRKIVFFLQIFNNPVVLTICITLIFILTHWFVKPKIHIKYWYGSRRNNTIVHANSKCFDIRRDAFRSSFILMYIGTPSVYHQAMRLIQQIVIFYSMSCNNYSIFLSLLLKTSCLARMAFGFVENTITATTQDQWGICYHDGVMTWKRIPPWWRHQMETFFA